MALYQIHTRELVGPDGYIWSCEFSFKIQMIYSLNYIETMQFAYNIRNEESKLNRLRSNRAGQFVDIIAIFPLNNIPIAL